MDADQCAASMHAVTGVGTAAAGIVVLAFPGIHLDGGIGDALSCLSACKDLPDLRTMVAPTLPRRVKAAGALAFIKDSIMADRCIGLVAGITDGNLDCGQRRAIWMERRSPMNRGHSCF